LQEAVHLSEPQTLNTSVLVHVSFNKEAHLDAELREFKLLAHAAGAVVVSMITAVRRAPDPRTFIGKGKVLELGQIVSSLGVELVIFDHDLSPSQERNWVH